MAIGLITPMDRGIGMDALITAGPQDIGDGAITIDTGVTATTTRETGITVNSGLKNLSPSTCVKVSPALTYVIYSLARAIVDS